MIIFTDIRSINVSDRYAHCWRPIVTPYCVPSQSLTYAAHLCLIDIVDQSMPKYKAITLSDLSLQKGNSLKDTDCLTNNICFCKLLQFSNLFGQMSQ